VRLSRRKSAAAVLGTGICLLLSTAPAQGADGSGVPPGGVACDGGVTSNVGIFAYGNATHNAAVTWTIRVSGSAGGSETELLRRTAWELKTVQVTAPAPGPVHYRLCITNTTSRSVEYRFFSLPRPGNTAVSQAAPHTAVLGSGGKACGEWIGGWQTPAARLVGAADTAVRFSVRAADGDGETLREEPIASGTSVDRLLTPPVTESYEICVTNTSWRNATISWDLLPV
jgi:hypothetical protein